MKKENQMNQLKPCPFCGAKAAGPTETTYGDSPPTYDAYVIECTQCTCDIEEETIAKAVTAWNARHGRDKMEWVSIKDRLPENATVLAYMPMVDYQYAILIYDKEWIDIADKTYEPDGEVTHWQSLPLPPEE